MFEDNRRARALFGQFDEHLAIIERDLHLQASTRGNQVTLAGSAVATDQARRVLDMLYGRLESQAEIAAGDVLVQVRACGICGSDIHGYDASTGRRIPPLVMGHEAAGTIERLGALQRVPRGPSPVKRLGHVVVKTSDFRTSEAWYKRRFGMLTSDEVYIGSEDNALGAFLRCIAMRHSRQWWQWVNSLLLHSRRTA